MNVEQVVLLVADFPQEFTLGARGDPVQYLYSAAFVDSLPQPVTSVTAPQSALRRSHAAVIAGLTQESGRDPRASPINLAGTIKGFAENRYSRRIRGHVRKIRSYTVTPAEMAKISEMTRGLAQTAYQPTEISLGEASAILFFPSTGTLGIVHEASTAIDDFSAGRGLEWQFVAGGPVSSYWLAVWAAQNGRRTTYGGRSPDIRPAYAAFGCHEGNDYCATDVSSMQVTMP